MNTLIRVFAVICIWLGVTLLAPIWNLSIGIYKEWQLYVGIILFVMAQMFFEEVGKRE